MIKALSYIVPVMMNFVFGALLFITVQRFTDAGASKLMTAMPLMAWALIYGVLNPLIGRMANSRNAAFFIMASGAATVISALGFIFFTGLYIQLALMALVGVAFAFYCVPFQIFAKRMESSGRSDSTNAVTKTAGRYTAAWSMGLAFGQLIFGFLAPGTGFIICMAIGAAITAGIWLADRNLPPETPAAPETPAVAGAAGSAPLPLPDLAWVGWIVGGIGTFTINQIRTQLQPLGTECGFDARQLAVMLFCVSFVQGIVALLLSCTSSKWQFRKLPALLVGLCGVIALAIFCSRDFAGIFYLGAGLFGIYSGCFYFYFVFYSLSHPTRSGFYAGINELTVSINSVAAPILGGLLANRQSTYPFMLSAAIVAAAAVIHITATGKKCFLPSIKE